MTTQKSFIKMMNYYIWLINMIPREYHDKEKMILFRNSNTVLLINPSDIYSIRKSSKLIIRIDCDIIYRNTDHCAGYRVILLGQFHWSVMLGLSAHSVYRQASNIGCIKSQNRNISRIILQLPCPIHWCQVLSREWRCNWSSADRRCSNYIWVIHIFVAY